MGTKNRRPPVLSLRTGRDDMIIKVFSRDPENLLESGRQVGDYSKSPWEFAIFIPSCAAKDFQLRWCRGTPPKEGPPPGSCPFLPFSL